MEVFTSELSRRLADRGHSVVLLTAGYAPRSWRRGNLLVRVLPSFDIFEGPVSPSLFLSIPRSDLVVAFVPNGFSAVIAWLRCRLSRQKYVVSILSIPSAGRAGGIFSSRLLPLILRGASFVHVPTAAYAMSCEAAVELQRLGPRVKVIPLGVDTDAFSPRGGTKPAVAKAKRKILFVGMFTEAHHRAKGLEYLLAALPWLEAKNVDFDLDIIGEGERKPYYESLAKELRLQGKVSFLSSVPNHMLPDIYRASDVLVLPSVRSSESFGIVVAEAMACGKPVIVSNMGGLPETADGGGIVVPPRDASSLSSALAEVLGDPRLSEELGKKGLVRAETYSWDRVVRQYEALFLAASRSN